MKLLNAIVLFILLLISWFVFSGYFNRFFIIAAIISCGIALAFSYWFDTIKTHKTPLFLNHFSYRYIIWLVKEIVFSTISVTKCVWHPRNIISPTTDWVEAGQDGETGLTLFANSITLTPGTISILVNDNRIYVHALVEEDLKHLQKGAMNQRVMSVTNHKMGSTPCS